MWRDRGRTGCRRVNGCGLTHTDPHGFGAGQGRARYVQVGQRRDKLPRGWAYTYPHARLTLNVGLLKSGPMTGSLVDGEPLVATYVGGKMYTKVTRGFLGYLGKPVMPQNLRPLRDREATAGPWPDGHMGFASTENILQHMTAGTDGSR